MIILRTKGTATLVFTLKGIGTIILVFDVINEGYLDCSIFSECLVTAMSVLMVKGIGTVTLEIE